MSDWTQDILDAEADIREDGELVTFFRPAGAVTDPAKPWKETAGNPEQWPDVPVLYMADGSAQFKAYMKGTDVPKGTTLALLPANVPFDPSQEMYLLSPSRGHLKIDGIDPLAPGSQTILYTLRLSQ